jgi:periplasmic protein TonB
MFEDSLVESCIGRVSPSKRWTTLLSISLQFAVAAVVVALPLLHPEALPFHVESPKVLLPLPLKPPVPVVRVERAATASTGVAAPGLSRPMILLSLLHSGAANDVPPPTPTGSGMGVPGGLPNGILAGDGGHEAVVSVTPAKAPGKTLAVSWGVSKGMLIAPIQPVYPAIARAARVEGTVIVEAVISRVGAIESLHVVSGPPMLQGAAIDAIRRARYKPYRLNGEPTEVQTMITVVFRLGS